MNRQERRRAASANETRRNGDYGSIQRRHEAGPGPELSGPNDRRLGHANACAVQDTEADFELSLTVFLEAVRVYARELTPVFKASEDYRWEEPPRDDGETEAMMGRVFRLLNDQSKGATGMSAAYVLGEALVMADEPAIIDHELTVFTDRVWRDYYIERGWAERTAMQ